MSPSKKLSKNSPTAEIKILGQPLYKVLKRKISDNISHNIWRAGEAIDSESVLQKNFKVSKGTVRKAIDELVTENILIRQQGLGTFVVSHDSDYYFFTFFRIINKNGKREFPQVELLSFTAKKASAEVAKALNINIGDEVYFYVNRLYLQEKAVIIDEIYIPKVLFPKLQENTLKNRKSTIYSFYQDKFGISVVRINEKAQAIKAESPYKELLNLSADSPLLLLFRIAFNHQDLACEYRKSYVNTAECEYNNNPLLLQ